MNMPTMSKSTLQKIAQILLGIGMFVIACLFFSPPVKMQTHLAAKLSVVEPPAVVATPDPTADRTITLPDVSGIVVSLADPSAILTLPDGSLNNIRHVQDLNGMKFIDVDGKVWTATWTEVQK